MVVYQPISTTTAFACQSGSRCSRSISSKRTISGKSQSSFFVQQHVVDNLQHGSLLQMSGFESEVIGFTSDVFAATTLAAIGDVFAQVAEKKNRNNDQVHEDQRQRLTIGDDAVVVVDDTDHSNRWSCFSPSSSSLDDSNHHNDVLFQREEETITNLRLSWDNLDSRRTSAYAVFGGGYTGGFQHFLFPNLQGFVPDPVARLALNQFLIIPLIYFPILIWLVPVLRGTSRQDVLTIRNNMPDIVQLMPTCWAFWIPLQFIQFNFIDADYQIIYCSFVGLVWKFLLSLSTANKSRSEAAQQQGTAASTK